MNGKNSTFEFQKVDVVIVENMLKYLKTNQDSKLHKDFFLANIFRDLSHLQSMLAQIIPLIKDNKCTSPSPSCLFLVNCWKRVNKQIQSYFLNNNFISNHQHTYRVGYSTCAVLTQMCDSRLTAMNNSMLVGAILIDFNAAFDLVDHDLLIKKLNYYGFKASALMWVSSYLLNRTQKVFVNHFF